MTLRTFSSILPFTRRFGVRGVTCMTNGALGGGGGGRKSIEETALEVLSTNGPIQATDWVKETAKRGNFSVGAVWRVVSQLIREHMRHGIIWTPDSPGGARGKYRLSSPGTSPKVSNPEIVGFAREILEEQPDGEFIKLANWIADTMERVASDSPGASFTRKGVHAAIHHHFIARGIANGEVEKGDRGMYRRKSDAAGFEDESGEPPAAPTAHEQEKQRRLEEAFYKPFAAYLRDVLLECDGAKSVGQRGETGIKFGRRWENPDVIGIAVSPENTNVNYTELVSAEIKVATNLWALMEGFGQASAYLRFSHKAYLVIPKETSCEVRLTELCHNSGIGLVTLDPDMDADDQPEKIFALLARARKREPVLPELDKHLQKLRKNGGAAGAKGLAKFGFKEDEE